MSFLVYLYQMSNGVPSRADRCSRHRASSSISTPRIIRRASFINRLLPSLGNTFMSAPAPRACAGTRSQAGAALVSSCVFVALTASVRPAASQPPTSPAAIDLTAPAVRTDTPPALDGNVIDDPAWSKAPVISGFWQTTPSEGAPASEQTEVRVMSRPEHALYRGRRFRP